MLELDRIQEGSVGAMPISRKNFEKGVDLLKGFG
jgi:hypothetical protein